MTIIVLTCFLVVGAAATSILGRDSAPASGVETTGSATAPVSNRESKKDKLTVVTYALASVPPAQNPIPQDPALSASLRQAYASVVPTDNFPPQIAAPGAMAPQAPKPKQVAKPPAPAVQKSYALLSDVQIAGIKERLKLSADQESYWPAVENSLRAIARKIHATRKSDPNAANALIDPDAEEVQQLKSAAMPLLFQLREDQKREVRALARIIGLERVASMI